MNKLLIAACAALALTSCGIMNGKTQKSSEMKHEIEKPMTGAYTDQHPLSKEDLALFQSVTADLDGVRYVPVSVATQVVAGTNYRFVCKAVAMTREAETYRAEITVFQPLPGRGAPRITAIRRL